MSPDSAPTQLGNYDIVATIAEGGMGTVYKALNRVTGEIVAVKVIAPTTAKNPVLLQRFEREFMAAKVLNHPNVVRAIEYYGNGPHPFLVMEFVDGESIGQHVERSGAFPEAEAVRLIAQVCEGLQRAHKQGLVHRDVKPDNILVTRDGADTVRQRQPARLLEEENPKRVRTSEGVEPNHLRSCGLGHKTGNECGTGSATVQLPGVYRRPDRPESDHANRTRSAPVSGNR
jgi:serine/threonine protein kinase